MPIKLRDNFVAGGLRHSLHRRLSVSSCVSVLNFVVPTFK